MNLRIYNTLTRQKEPFTPLVPGAVGMYVCGVTPYDVSHIGHARSALVFDVVARYLEHARYRVTFVKNYTDVDDKIIARANQLQRADRGADRAIHQVLRGRHGRAGRPAAARRLRGRPSTSPRWSALIERLVAAGAAYVVDGDVYFEVARFPDLRPPVGQEPR